MTPSEHLTRIATTGRDHGRKAVIRMAELLPKCAFTGALYVASGSVEFGEKDRLTDGGIPEMASRFEISGHTLNPVRLTGPGKEEPEHITAGKWLPDDVTEGLLKSICYPNVVYSREQRVLDHISRRDDAVFTYNAAVGPTKRRVDVSHP